MMLRVAISLLLISMAYPTGGPEVRHFEYFDNKYSWLEYLQKADSATIENYHRRGLIWEDSAGQHYIEILLYEAYVMYPGMRFRLFFFNRLEYLGGVKEFCYRNEMTEEGPVISIIDPDTLVTEIWRIPQFDIAFTAVYAKEGIYGTIEPEHGYGWFVSKEDRLDRLNRSREGRKLGRK